MASIEVARLYLLEDDLIQLTCTGSSCHEFFSREIDRPIGRYCIEVAKSNSLEGLSPHPSNMEVSSYVFILYDYVLF